MVPSSPGNREVSSRRVTRVLSMGVATQGEHEVGRTIAEFGGFFEPPGWQPQFVGEDALACEAIDDGGDLPTVEAEISERRQPDKRTNQFAKCIHASMMGRRTCPCARGWGPMVEHPRSARRSRYSSGPFHRRRRQNNTMMSGCCESDDVAGRLRERQAFQRRPTSAIVKPGDDAQRRGCDRNAPAGRWRRTQKVAGARRAHCVPRAPFLPASGFTCESRASDRKLLATKNALTASSVTAIEGASKTK